MLQMVYRQVDVDNSTPNSNFQFQFAEVNDRTKGRRVIKQRIKAPVDSQRCQSFHADDLFHSPLVYSSPYRAFSTTLSSDFLLRRNSVSCNCPSCTQGRLQWKEEADPHFGPKGIFDEAPGIMTRRWMPIHQLGFGKESTLDRNPSQQLSIKWLKCTQNYHFNF